MIYRFVHTVQSLKVLVKDVRIDSFYQEADGTSPSGVMLKEEEKTDGLVCLFNSHQVGLLKCHILRCNVRNRLELFILRTTSSQNY